MKHPWSVKTFVHRLSVAGHKRTVMSSDGEPSILAWKTRVAAGLTRLHGIEVVREERAAGDSQGNGSAEHNSKCDVKARIRTL